jgi:hypothetical protein
LNPPHQSVRLVPGARSFLSLDPPPLSPQSSTGPLPGVYADLVTVLGFKPSVASEKGLGGFDSHPLPLPSRNGSGPIFHGVRAVSHCRRHSLPKLDVNRAMVAEVHAACCLLRRQPYPTKAMPPVKRKVKKVNHIMPKLLFSKAFPPWTLRLITPDILADEQMSQDNARLCWGGFGAADYLSGVGSLGLALK